MLPLLPLLVVAVWMPPLLPLPLVAGPASAQTGAAVRQVSWLLLAIPAPGWRRQPRGALKPAAAPPTAPGLFLLLLTLLLRRQPLPPPLQPPLLLPRFR